MPTDDLLAAWDWDGFARLGRVLDADALAAIRGEEARFRPVPLRNDRDVPGASTVFRSQVCRHSPAVRAVVAGGRHLDAVERLIGPDVLFFYTQFVTKLPEADRARAEFPWHQDLGYLAIAPLERTVTVWVALDDVDERNGCVWVAPGSHRRGLLPHRRRSPTSWNLEVAVDGDGVPVPLRAGEAVAFTGLTLHRSLANATDRPRRGFFMEYVPATAVELASGAAIVDRADAWVVRGGVPLGWTAAPPR